VTIPVEQTHGEKETRGARIGHSIRLPGFVIAFETIFGLPHERLTIRHDAGASSPPYVHRTTGGAPDNAGDGWEGRTGFRSTIIRRSRERELLVPCLPSDA